MPTWRQATCGSQVALQQARLVISIGFPLTAPFEGSAQTLRLWMVFYMFTLFLLNFDEFC
jgi:hypothetical protein